MILTQVFNILGHEDKVNFQLSIGDYLQIWFLPSFIDTGIHLVYLNPLKSIAVASVYSFSVYTIMIVPKFVWHFTVFETISRVLFHLTEGLTQSLKVFETIAFVLVFLSEKIIASLVEVN